MTRQEYLKQVTIGNVSEKTHLCALGISPMCVGKDTYVRWASHLCVFAEDRQVSL